MPRPRKFRRIMYMPKFNSFGPLDTEVKDEDVVIMNVEEVESIRLMDLEGLDQVKCAEIMNIARSTFQRIYSEAKRKMADSLVNGKKLLIQGGDYTLNKCEIVCNSCGNTWEESSEILNNETVKCPKCGSDVDLRCNNENDVCRHCSRGRNGNGRGYGRRWSE
ncbi:DUF134 domain-containing protein [Clostridium aestuarii]|uniref:UPF0251 protein OW763_13475 n=1 Tax=Clostridium aestuarii TaxID=338193 RepID=A0ABT4D261_9CLOT|nr:DUF134 domain-containing protein [Clostridium aestuarii]MCY6485342.1 DUF134 domain-containing protein [Clostridium aestuarii]